MQTKLLDLCNIQLNEKNPRTISDDKFEKLVNSLLSLPKMLEIRPIVVDAEGIVLGGNMRLRALSEIATMSEDELASRLDTIRDIKKKTAKERSALFDHWKQWIANSVVPVVDASTLTSAEQKEFIIKDNGNLGEWDWDLLSDWNFDDLKDWGIDLPNFFDDDLLANPLDITEDLSEETYEEPEKDMYECPHCHHVDSKVHFKKVK